VPTLPERRRDGIISAKFSLFGQPCFAGVAGAASASKFLAINRFAGWALPRRNAATIRKQGRNDAHTDNFLRNVLHRQDIALRSLLAEATVFR
jgi:hypothetical protein